MRIIAVPRDASDEQGGARPQRNGNAIQTSFFNPRRLGAKTGDRNLCRDGSTT